MDEMKRLIWLNRFHTQDKVDLLNALKDRFGSEVVEIVERVECEKAHKEWKAAAEQAGDNSIEALISLLWEPLKTKGYEYTFEVQENGIQMHCTKCPAYDLAKEIGATDWLYHHTCSTDACIASGFNPKIGFRRTKTLMQGDEYCDHYYYYVSGLENS